MTEREYWTTDELAKRWKVSGDALHRFREAIEDPLPHLRAGRRYLYIPDEVEGWARRQAERTASGSASLQTTHS